MAFDVTKHQLVPKHSKLTDSEKEVWLKEQAFDFRQLPRIMKNDPTLLHLNAKVGDVIRIERHSQTAGISVYYRVVAEK